MDNKPQLTEEQGNSNSDSNLKTRPETVYNLDLEKCKKNVKDKDNKIQKSDFHGWRRFLGVVYALLGTIFLSLSALKVKAYSHINVYTLWTWAHSSTFALSLLFTLYYALVEKKQVLLNVWPLNKNKKNCFLLWFRGLATGFLGYLISYTLRYISVADNRTIVSAHCLTVYFFGWLFLKEKLGYVVIIVAAIVLSGVGVMMRPPILTGDKDFDLNTLIGMSFALGCLLMRTSSTIIMRYLRNVHEGTQNCVIFAWAFVQSIVVAFALGEFESLVLKEILGVMSIGFLFGSGCLLMAIALHTEEAGIVSLICTSDVVFAFIFQFIFLGVVPDMYSVLGAVIIVSGVFMVTLRKWVTSLKEDNPTRKKLSFLLH